MKLPHKIIRSYRNKDSLGRRKFIPHINKEFKTFAIRLGNGIYWIAEDNNIYEMKKYWIVLGYRFYNYRKVE
jgi:hypothetical protein